MGVGWTGTAERLVVDQVTYLLVFAVASAVAFVTTRATMLAARHFGVLDRPGPRKFHTVATPRLGGIGIIAGVSLPMLALLIFPAFRWIYLANQRQLNGLLIGGLLIFGLGLYDDLFGADAWKKLFIQTLAAAILVSSGFLFDVVSIFGMTFDLNGWAGIATIVWIVGIINAVNFIDGMDGLAATVSLTIAIVFGIISFVQSNLMTFLLMVALAGSLSGFLPFNRRPAKIFMGDTGSMFLGLLLATMTVAGSTKSPASIALAGPMLALALPILDTMFVVRGRLAHPGLKLGERVFRMFNADRSHFHHRLYAHFGSEAKVVGTLWLLTALFGTAGILTAIPATEMFGYAIAAGALTLVIVLRVSSRPAETLDEAPEPLARIESWTPNTLSLPSPQPIRATTSERSRNFGVPYLYVPELDEEEAAAYFFEEADEEPDRTNIRSRRPSGAAGSFGAQSSSV